MPQILGMLCTVVGAPSHPGRNRDSPDRGRCVSPGALVLDPHAAAKKLHPCSDEIGHIRSNI